MDPGSTTPEAERLEAALTRVDAQGRFDAEDVPAIRALTAHLAADPTTADLHPTELLGPWGDLPEVVREHLRAWCQEEIAGAMRLHPKGPLWAGFVRWLNTQVYRLGPKPAPRRQAALEWLAGLIWRRPRMIWRAIRRRREIRAWRAARPTVVGFCRALGKDPDWLMAGYATAVRVDPRCRGFHLDRARNIVWGYLLGIDVVPTPSGVICHEANLDAGLSGRMRKGYWDEDPIPKGLEALASDAGFRNIVWMSGVNQPIDPWFYGELRRILTGAGLDIQVLEDEQAPVRHDLPSDLPVPGRAPFAPENPEPNTLVVRARDLKVGPDALMVDKKCFAQAVGTDLQRTGESRVRVLPGRRHPPQVSLPEDPGLPNLVYKYPLGGKGEGVFFLRVRDREQAIKLGREIDGRTGRTGGVFQPWVCSPLLPGRRIYEFRTIILVTPVGVRFLGARRRETVTPLPDTLPEGIVEDRRPFIITGYFENISVPRDPALEGPVAAASLAVAESLARLLKRGFVTEEG